MLTPQAGIQVDRFYPPTDWQYSFPEGYTRLEYLQSSGTQYIDTGYVPNVDDIIETDIQQLGADIGTGDKFFFGQQNIDSSKGGLWVEQHGRNNAWYVRFGSTSSVSADPTNQEKTDKIHLTLQKESFVSSGGTTLSPSWSGTMQTTNLTLFGRFSSNGTTIVTSIIKMWNFKVTRNGEVKLNLIPVLRKSDNELGMLDLANVDASGNYVFYVNKGTGEFVMGPELYTNKSQIDIRQKNNLNFGKNYKFNTNNELTWANPNLYLTGKVNYTKVGNPTITDNVVSEFSDSNYIELQQPFILNVNTISEIIIKINFNNESSGQVFLGHPNTYGIQMIRSSGDSKIHLYLGNNNSWSLINNAVGTTVLSSLTNYYIKVVFNKGNVQVLLSTDKINWTTEINRNITLTQEYSYIIDFGKGRASNQYLKGSIDLKETYIKVNDKLWFYGKNYTSENYAPVPAGLNYNNTTTPSIGYVNTQTQEFIPAPTDGIKYSQTRDIKVIPPEDNTITLLYGVKSNFSKYSLFGLIANVSSGTYDIYIDDVLYATTASETQTDIDFSTLGAEYVSIGTCTTPEELVLHKIVIKPTNNGETITRFACRRTTGATGTQQQGILWANLQLENNLTLGNCFGTETAYNNRILYAVTAKNNKITVTSTSTNTTGLYSIYARCASLVYSPILEYSTKDYINGVYLSFDQTKLKRITIKNNPSIDMTIIRNAQQLEKIDIENPISLRSNTASGNSAQNAYKLELFPKYETETRICDNINMYDTTSLYPTKINDSTNKLREFLRMYGSSTYPMRGLRGLKVSNEAPFSGTSPQINVSYTGLDRDALVELFNFLPDVSEATDGITRTLSCVAATGNNLTVVGSPTIDANGVASGFSSNDYLNIVGNINLSSNFKIQIKITPSSVTTGSKKFLSIFYTNSIYLDFYTSGTTPRIDCQYSGGAYWTEIATNLSYDIPIVITIKGNGTNLNIDINQNNVTQTGTKTLQKLGISDINATVYLGRGHTTSLPMVNGTIDLENTYIKVDNNYLMKGYLTDNDRLIATNKGWTITG